MPDDEMKWELVFLGNDGSELYCLDLDDRGWIYKTIQYFDDHPPAMSVCFVPLRKRDTR